MQLNAIKRKPHSPSAGKSYIAKVSLPLFGRRCRLVQINPVIELDFVPGFLTIVMSDAILQNAIQCAIVDQILNFVHLSAVRALQDGCS